MNLLKYTNGLGHLIMSLALVAVGLTLAILGRITEGMWIITTVATAWFVPGAAKAAVREVAEVANVTTQPLASGVGDKTE